MDKFMIYMVIALTVGLVRYLWLLHTRNCDPDKYYRWAGQVKTKDWFVSLVTGMFWPISIALAFVDFCVLRQRD